MTTNIGEVIEDIIDTDTGEIIARRPRIMFREQGRTQQEFKHEVNINTIVARMKAGQLPDQAGITTCLQADFSRGNDYNEAADRIAEADARFMGLPGKVRAIAHNNPGVFLEMLNNPTQAQRLVDAGLDASQAPLASPPAPPAAPAPAAPGNMS